MFSPTRNMRTTSGGEQPTSWKAPATFWPSRIDCSTRSSFAADDAVADDVLGGADRFEDGNAEA